MQEDADSRRPQRRHQLLLQGRQDCLSRPFPDFRRQLRTGYCAAGIHEHQASVPQYRRKDVLPHGAVLPSRRSGHPRDGARDCPEAGRADSRLRNRGGNPHEQKSHPLPLRDQFRELRYRQKVPQQPGKPDGAPGGFGQAVFGVRPAGGEAQEKTETGTHHVSPGIPCLR